MMLRYILFAGFLLTISGITIAQDLSNRNENLSQIKIEELSGIPVRNVSVGPEREQVVEIN